MSAGSTTIDNIKLCCFTFQALILEIWNENWKAMVKKSLIISNWPDLFWGQSSLWSSAPIHPIAHLGIALRNNSLSDDHLTKYLKKSETDQILFWNISYLKKSSQLKMGQRYSSSHILKGSRHVRKVQFFLTLFKRPLTPPLSFEHFEHFAGSENLI